MIMLPMPLHELRVAHSEIDHGARTLDEGDKIVERECRRRAQVEQELRGINPRSKRQRPIPDGWISSEEAGLLMACNRYQLRHIGVPNRSRGGEGKASQGVGAIYERALIERIALLMRECELGAATAARVALAERAGRI